MPGAALFLCACGSERPAAESEKHSDSGTVVLTGHLSSDTTAEQESLRFWVTVENRTAAPIENVRIAHLDTPGFKKLRWCWTPGANAQSCGAPADKDPACRPPVAPANPGADEFSICQYLKPGESLSVWGDLLVEDPWLPAERLYAVVSWKGTAASGSDAALPASSGKAVSMTSSRAVPLGTAEPVSTFHPLTWLTKPEVSIPGALAILGLYLTWLAGRREERSKVFTAMLGAVHDAAIHYFMPMTSTLSVAMLYIRKASKEKTSLESARRGFYYLTMFHWWQRRVLNKVGAYQLTSRTGEKLLLALAGKHRELYPRETEAAWRRLDVILTDLEKETTLDEFLLTLDSGDPDWTGAWSDFQTWVTDRKCAEDLVFLDAFTLIMLHEVNSLHELWYGSRYPLKLSDETRAAIFEVAKGEFRFQVEDYLQKAENADTTLRHWG